MDVIITDWALSSYLDLHHRGIFTDAEYWSTIRPDVVLLKTYPTDPKFSNSGFWGPAQVAPGNVVPHGHKMKWHNVGPGQVQLRVCVAILGDAFLCEAYEKKNASYDQRMQIRFAGHIRNLRTGNYIQRGKL